MSLRCAFAPLCVDKAHRNVVLGWLGAGMLCAALLLAPTSQAAAAAPKTTVNEIEGEVMCPVCGTLLELADSPQARREKVFVAGLVAEGKSDSEVKDALVAQYGEEVLATPKASGFDLSAYLVPILAIALAAIVLAYSVLRWRRNSEPGDGSTDRGAAQPPRGEDAERLEADLSRYDL
jgi:cytochrome c-type biogenesis protein CcmH